MLKDENIIRSFFQRSILATILLAVLSTVLIYLYQNYSFYNTLTKEIKSHIPIIFKKDALPLQQLNKDTINADVEKFMLQSGFSYIEIYNKEKEKLFTFRSKDKYYATANNIIDHNRQLFPNKFPIDIDDMEYELLELEGENSFLQIIYPIYSEDHLFGYVEGITLLDRNLVNRYKQDIMITISTVILTIILMSLFIFPIIYFAFKRLQHNKNTLVMSNMMTLDTLGNAIALRDDDTNIHNYRVTIYAIRLAQYIKLDKNNMRRLIKGAFLHDVGKIGIRDKILLKPEKLSDYEYEVMKKHVTKGVELIKGNEWLKDSHDIILLHHEKFDGKGYPNGLKGEKIPLIVRIFSIVDVFDALTSKRPYKAAYTYEKSIQILKEGKEKQFDPLLLKKFFEISGELYTEINSKTSSQLKEMLDTLIKKYFLDE